MAFSPLAAVVLVITGSAQPGAGELVDQVVKELDVRVEGF
jgi:hypothetical protein